MVFYMLEELYACLLEELFKDKKVAFGIHLAWF